MRRVTELPKTHLPQRSLQGYPEHNSVDVILQLTPVFRVFPQFQTHARLISEFQLGVGNSGYDPSKVMAMLKEAKPMCYDKRCHPVHLIFYTRELVPKWGKAFSTLISRNRRFQLWNAHQPVTTLPDDPEQRAVQVRARQ